MRYLFLFILVFLCIQVYAQKVLFTDTTNKWSLLTTFPDGHSSRSENKYIGDTVLYGKAYSILNYRLGIAVREDILARKIYFLSSIQDSIERVFFDYHLQPNDTFSMVVDTLLLKHVVQSIDSVQLGGIYHRVWSMQCITPTSFYRCENYTFIEGVGTTSGPAFQLFPLVFEGCKQLRCFSQKGIMPSCVPTLQVPCGGVPIGAFYPYDPVSTFDNSTSCNYALGTEEVSLDGVPTLFPNPGDRNTVLRIPSVQPSTFSLIVINMSGQLVLEKQVEGGQDFSLYPYIRQSGLYFYTLQAERTGQRWVGKFIYKE